MKLQTLGPTEYSTKILFDTFPIPRMALSLRGGRVDDVMKDFDFEDSLEFDSSVNPSDAELSASDVDVKVLNPENNVKTNQKKQKKGKAGRGNRSYEDDLNDPEEIKAFLDSQRDMIKHTYGDDLDNNPEAAKYSAENFTIPEGDTVEYEQYTKFRRQMLLNASIRTEIRDLGPNPHYRPSGTPVEELPEWDGRFRYEDEDGQVYVVDTENLDHVNETASPAPHRPAPDNISRPGRLGCGCADIFPVAVDAPGYRDRRCSGGCSDCCSTEQPRGAACLSARQPCPSAP